jgi:hypothetical protein
MHDTESAFCEAEERLEHEATQREGGTPTDKKKNKFYLR